MGKRWVPAADADRRAVLLLRQWQAVAEMPRIRLRILRDGKTIFVGNQDDPLVFKTMSVETFLALDVAQAIARGGTWEELVTSWRTPARRVPQVVVDEAVNDMLSGKDEL